MSLDCSVFSHTRVPVFPFVASGDYITAGLLLVESVLYFSLSSAEAGFQWESHVTFVYRKIPLEKFNLCFY
jgi:hypothetical protein